MENSLFKYKAELEKVVDGDTIFVTLDMGLNIFQKKFKIRYARIDAPEIGDAATREDGIKSKKYLESLLLNNEIIIDVLLNKKDKYGRYLCEVYSNHNGNWINTGDDMLNTGNAILYKGFIETEFIY